jgi:uncharacterized protein DUF4386
MSPERVSGVLVLIAPIWFNVTFAILGRSFDYPNILRRPTDEVLTRFRAGGSRLILQWWAFMLSGVAFVPVAVLLPNLTGGQGLLPPVATTVGVLAAAVQVIGLLRWVYLVPYLARTNADATASPATREATGVVFQSFHRFFGVGIGEHLGYLFTGIWTLLIGIGMMSGTAFASWLGWVGVLVGAGLAIGSTEFLGPHEESGWSLAGKAVPILYVLWSLWLFVVGLTLLLRS